MIAFGGFAIFFAGYLAASTLLLFMIVRTLHGGPFGMLTTANATAAIDVLPSSRRTEGIGYYGLSNNLAMALAPTIGIFIYQLTSSFEFLFWLALIVACVGWMVDSTVTFSEKDIVRNKSKLSWDRFFLIRGWLIGMNMIAFGFSFGVLSNYLAIYGKEVMGIMGGTGTYFMLCSVGLMLSRLQGSKGLRNGRVTHNAGEGMVISLIGYTLFILMPTFFPQNHSAIMVGYYGSALLIGLGNGHMWPAFQNMTINVAKNNQRGTANSTILISWDIGMGLGILIGGIVAELISYGAAFWTVVLINASGVACYFLATKSFFLRRNLNPTVR
jgi:MFS family permease